MCHDLLCRTATSADCFSRKSAAADGTECAEGKWCYQGECVDNGSVFVIPDQQCHGKLNLTDQPNLQ